MSDKSEKSSGVFDVQMYRQPVHFGLTTIIRSSGFNSTCSLGLRFARYLVVMLNGQFLEGRIRL